MDLIQTEESQLPLAQIRVVNGFSGATSSIEVLVDEQPIARLPVTNVSFKRAYNVGVGFIKFRMIAGDCQFETRP